MESGKKAQLKELFNQLPEQEQDDFLAEELADKKEADKKEFNKIMTKAYRLEHNVYFFDAMFITKRYELFGFLKGNRKISKDNANRINRSTKVNGQVPIAITTIYNQEKKNYTIIDGQTRFAGWSANQEFPIVFTNTAINIDNNTLVKIMQGANTSQSHWVFKNFVESGAEISVSYKNLLKLLEKYNMKNNENEKIPVWTIVDAVVGMCGYSGNGVPKKMVELGLVECTDKFDSVRSLLDELIPIHNKLCSTGFYSKITGKKDRFLSILSFFIQRDNFDANHFLTNMTKYGMLYNFNKTGRKELFDFIQEIYDKDLKPSQKLDQDLYMTFIKQNEKARKYNNDLIIKAEEKNRVNLDVKKVAFTQLYDSAI